MTTEETSVRRSNYSSKLAQIREWAASQPKSALPPPMPPRIYNSPVRAAKGHGVPPSKRADAPRFFDRFGVDPCLKIKEVNMVDGPTTYVIVGPDGVSFYAEADRMADLLSWLTEYAYAVDSAQQRNVSGAE